MKKKENGRCGTLEVMKKLGVSPERLRYWEKLGIVKPKHTQCGTRKFRRYSQEDIHRGALIKTLVDTQKYTLKDAIKKLQEEEL